MLEDKKKFILSKQNSSIIDEDIVTKFNISISEANNIENINTIAMQEETSVNESISYKTIEQSESILTMEATIDIPVVELNKTNISDSDNSIKTVVTNDSEVASELPLEYNTQHDLAIKTESKTTNNTLIEIKEIKLEDIMNAERLEVTRNVETKIEEKLEDVKNEEKLEDKKIEEKHEDKLEDIKIEEKLEETKNEKRSIRKSFNKSKPSPSKENLEAQQKRKEEREKKNKLN